MPFFSSLLFLLVDESWVFFLLPFWFVCVCFFFFSFLLLLCGFSFSCFFLPSCVFSTFGMWVFFPFCNARSAARQRQVMAALEALSENEEELLAFENKLNTDGKAQLGPEGFEITKGMASWVKGTKKISEIKFTPSVIEPSFGERGARRRICSTFIVAWLKKYTRRGLRLRAECIYS